MSFFNPTYKTQSGATAVETELNNSPLPITIDEKTIPGYLTTFSDGTAKWTSQQTINTTPLATLNSFDYSTFTGEKDSNGNWIWKETTDNSIPNLSKATGIEEQKIEDTIQTTSFQQPLNGIRIIQLGGVSEAEKIDPTLPGTGGTVSPSDPNTQLSASASEEPTPNFKGQGKAETLESKYNLKLGGGKYPLDLDTDGEGGASIDYVYFQAAELNISSGLVGSSSNLSTIFGDIDSRREFIAVEGGPVIIGAQAPIRGQNRVGWREGQLNAFEAAFYNTAYNMIGNDAYSLSNDVKKAFNEFKSNLGDDTIKELIQRAAAAQAVSNPSIFTRSSALILNPNIELLFNKPELRTFPFQFMLTAREGKENIQIKNIIKYFKYHMAPKVVATNLFLKTPHVFFIEYVKAGSGEHKGLNLIAPQRKRNKACALISFDVDYTPLGRYMTFDDGDNMFAYTLSLVFQDINPVYDIDYDDPHPIGY